MSDHNEELIALTASIVSAYVTRNNVPTAELPRVIEFLNSKEATVAQKRSFISLVAQKSVGLFDLLFDQSEASITDEGVKDLLRRTAAAVAKRKAKKQEAATAKSAQAGEAPPAK